MRMLNKYLIVLKTGFLVRKRARLGARGKSEQK